MKKEKNYTHVFIFGVKVGDFGSFMDKGLDPLALAESSEDGASQIVPSRHEEKTKHEKDKPNEQESSEPLPDSGDETFLPTTQNVVFKNPDMETCFLERAVESGLSKKPSEGEGSSNFRSLLLRKKQKIKGGVFHKPDICYSVSQINKKGLSEFSSRSRKSRKLGHPPLPSKSFKHYEDIVRRDQGVTQKDFLKIYHQPSPYVRSGKSWVRSL